MKRLSISYPLLILAALALAFDRNGWLLLLMAAAAVHELGHIAAIAALGGRIERVSAGLTGMKIEYASPRMTSYAADMAMAMSGPIANLAALTLCCVAARFYPPLGDESLYYFCGVNLLFALFNLVPAGPLDGGRVLRAFLMGLLGGDRGERAAAAVSTVSFWLLTAAGLALLLTTRSNASLLFASLVVLLSAGGRGKREPRQNHAAGGRNPPPRGRE